MPAPERRGREMCEICRKAVRMVRKVCSKYDIGGLENKEYRAAYDMWSMYTVRVTIMDAIIGMGFE